MTGEHPRCPAQVLGAPQAVGAEKHDIDRPFCVRVEEIVRLRVTRPERPGREPESVHGHDRPLVEREQRTGSPEQRDVRAVGSRWRPLVAHEDRPPKNGVARQRLLALPGHVGLGIQQDVDQTRSRLGKPVEVQGAGHDLSTQLVLESLGELPHRIVLALGHHECDLWHGPDRIGVPSSRETAG